MYRKIAARVNQFHDGAHVIVMQNVIGHVDDPVLALASAKGALKAGGTVIVECPYEPRMLDSCDYGQIYHEHLSYWSVRPMLAAASRAGLIVAGVQEYPDLHGGSMRYTLTDWDSEKLPMMWEKIATYAEREDVGHPNQGLGDALFLSRLERHMATVRQTVRLGGRCWAYGASAKLHSVLNLAEVRVEKIIDDAPSKQGKFSPGLPIPIEGPQPLACDTLIVGSWNWAQVLAGKARALGYRGKIVSLFPEPRVVLEDAA
jgi:hypothetical protein